MTTGNNCSCSTNTCSTNMCGSRSSSGFLIVLVLYILLAIIIGSAFFY